MSSDFQTLVRDANSGNVEAQLAVCELWFMHGFPLEAKSAVAWLSRLSSSDSSHAAQAKELLGRVHSAGRGIPQDLPKAVELFRSAATMGSKDAQFHLAMLLMEGSGVQKNEMEAMAWLEAAAKQEHPEACFHLAQIYEIGGPVARNNETALKLFKQSARHTLRLKIDAKEKEPSSLPDDFSPDEIRLAQEYFRHLKIPLESLPERINSPDIVAILHDVRAIVASHSKARDEYALSLFTTSASLRPIKEEYKDLFRRVAFRAGDAKFRLADFSNVILTAAYKNDFDFFKDFGRQLEKSVAAEKPVDKLRYFLLAYWTNVPGGSALCFHSDPALGLACVQLTGPKDDYDDLEGTLAKLRYRLKLKKAEKFLIPHTAL